MTGSYTADELAANALGGFAEKDPAFTWHHLDYDPVTGEGTLQLVDKDVHVATNPDAGGVSQWEQSTGLEYKR